ncbi:hypothetical protein ACHAQH_002576 [Verticillium albo-atrum]
MVYPPKQTFAPRVSGYFYTETRVMRFIPNNPPPEHPTSVTSEIKYALRSTAVKAAERTPQMLKTTYYMNERGQIIETRWMDVDKCDKFEGHWHVM